MGCIYKIKNDVNKKLYIGLTSRTAAHRFKKHKSMVYSEGCSALYKAMKKYGTQNFHVETIFKTDDPVKLMEAEKFFILLYNTVSPDGYNLTTGGENFIMSEESKKKLSKKMKGRKITWGNKVSSSLKKLWEDPEYRVRQTLQRYEKRGKYREGIVRPLRSNISTDEIKKLYESGHTINKISKIMGVSFYTIKRRLDL